MATPEHADAMLKFLQALAIESPDPWTLDEARDYARDLLKQIAPEAAAGPVGKITYWLYRHDAIVASIRLPKGTPDDTVRSEALEAHRRNPTIYADFPDVLPSEQAVRIVRAEVRTYSGGN